MHRKIKGTNISKFTFQINKRYKKEIQLDIINQPVLERWLLTTNVLFLVSGLIKLRKKQLEIISF